MARSIRLTQIISRTRVLVTELHGAHFAAFIPSTQEWRPEANVYAYDDHVEVCFELAGIPKEDIDVQVEPRRLVVAGKRQSPERHCPSPPCGRILVMEIPEGPFRRVIEFPFDVDVERVEARKENGWLWITLPIVKQGGVS